MTTGLQIKSSDYLQTPEGKKYFNEQHFTEAARRYDIATWCLSLGRDFYWKKMLIKALPPLAAPNCLDLACGTGDLSFALAKKYPAGTVRGVDLTEAMLEIARNKNRYSNLSFLKRDICDLDLPQSSFDIVTGSYALRNAPDLGLALRNISSVLRPGGIAAFLDFSKPKDARAQQRQYWLLKVWGSFWGLMLHANPEVHGYISASLKSYPAREQLGALFKEDGFQALSRRSLFFGMLELSLLRKG